MVYAFLASIVVCTVHTRIDHMSIVLHLLLTDAIIWTENKRKIKNSYFLYHVLVVKFDDVQGSIILYLSPYLWSLQAESLLHAVSLRTLYLYAQL